MAGGKKKKPVNVAALTIIMSMIVIVILITVAALAPKSKAEGQVKRQLEAGRNFLEDADYGKALAEFQTALEIDESNVDAWIGLADAYARSGQWDEARKALRDGYARTKNAALMTKLEEIEVLYEKWQRARGMTAVNPSDSLPKPTPEETPGPEPLVTPGPTVVSAPTPTAELVITPTPTPMPEITVTVSHSPRPTITPPPDLEIVPTPTPMPEITVTVNHSPRPTITPPPGLEIVATPTATPTPTPTPTPQWSDWVEALPDGVTDANYDVESKVQYSYQNKTTITSEDATLESQGYTFDWTFENYTEYGDWSSWSTTQQTTSDLKKEETQIRYSYRDLTAEGEWSDWSSYSTTEVTASDTREVRTKTYYRYATREKYYVYHYSKWSDWSSWGNIRMTETANRRVKTRTVYRYKRK